MDKENARTTQNQTPSSPDGDQREPFPPRFEPGPLFLLGPDSRRGQPIAAKSNRRAALLARKKRGAAVATPATTAKALKSTTHRSQPTTAACEARSYSKEERFPKPNLRADKFNRAELRIY